MKPSAFLAADVLNRQMETAVLFDSSLLNVTNSDQKKKGGVLAGDTCDSDS
jgi:hypothetical protein